MAIQFKELRKYLARNIRLSICFEDGHYHDYLMISDIPAEKYNDLYLYGVGMADVEFSKDIYTFQKDLDGEIVSTNDDTIEPAIEIVLHENSREIERKAEDVLEKLTEQLETDGRQIFCVIDELPLLSTHKKRKSRIEENCVVLKELNEFSQKYGVEFVCNVVVSKWSQDYKTAINELREYAPMDYFNGKMNFMG